MNRFHNQSSLSLFAMSKIHYYHKVTNITIVNNSGTLNPPSGTILNTSKVQLLDAILHELSSNGFSDSEASDFWSDFDNLQKAKIIR